MLKYLLPSLLLLAPLSQAHASDCVGKAAKVVNAVRAAEGLTVLAGPHNVVPQPDTDAGHDHLLVLVMNPGGMRFNAYDVIMLKDGCALVSVTTDVAR